MQSTRVSTIVVFLISILVDSVQYFVIPDLFSRIVMLW